MILRLTTEEVEVEVFVDERYNPDILKDMGRRVVELYAGIGATDQALAEKE